MTGTAYVIDQLGAALQASHIGLAQRDERIQHLDAEVETLRVAVEAAEAATRPTVLLNGRTVYRLAADLYAATTPDGGWLPGTRASVLAWSTDDGGTPDGSE